MKRIFSVPLEKLKKFLCLYFIVYACKKYRHIFADLSYNLNLLFLFL